MLRDAGLLIQAEYVIKDSKVKPVTTTQVDLMFAHICSDQRSVSVSRSTIQEASVQNRLNYESFKRFLVRLTRKCYYHKDQPNQFVSKYLLPLLTIDGRQVRATMFQTL
jgi:hypothetical protein